MASYKSHHNAPPRTESRIPQARRTPSSRPPLQPPMPAAVPTPLPPSSTPKLVKKRPGRDLDVAQKGRTPNDLRTGDIKGTDRVEAARMAFRNQAAAAHVAKSKEIPRSVPQSSSSRLPKPDMPVSTRTPSLISGSSISTVESPMSSMSRQRPSPVIREARSRSESASSREPDELKAKHDDAFADTVLGITLPTSSASLYATVDAGVEAQYADVLVALDATHQLDTMDLPPPTSQYVLSASPSTRYSESPGVFSHSSTPTSMSSYSPAVGLNPKAAPRTRQSSPTRSRPPPVRRRTEENTNDEDSQGLSTVRESSTSSSSASTVRHSESTRQKEKQRQSRLSIASPVLEHEVSGPAVSSAISPTAARPIAGSGTSRKAVPMQTPPEFAHLAVDIPRQQTAQRPPARPSRNGTPDYISLREASPVIQSNMTSLPARHGRQGSSDSTRKGSVEIKARPIQSSKPPSRLPSPSPNLQGSSTYPPPTRIPISRVTTPSSEAQSDGERATKTTPAPPAASPSKSMSRFGFFRRNKTEPSPATAPKEKKLRKGPMAGTGHEGYGKYAGRGRSGSTTSGSGSGSAGRSNSASSDKPNMARTPSSRKNSSSSRSSGEVDDFFLERLTPVILRGEGHSDRLVRSPDDVRSTTSLSSAGEQLHYGLGLQSSGASSDASLVMQRPTLLPSAMNDSVRTSSPLKRMPGGQLRMNGDHAANALERNRTLAARRSFRNSQVVSGSSGPTIAPINTTMAPSTTSLNSATSGAFSGAESITNVSRASDVSDSKESSWLRSKKTKFAGQPKAKSKWNIFSRKDSAPKKSQQPAPVSVSVMQDQAPRAVAHYAMPTSAGIDLDEDELDRIMNEADDGLVNDVEGDDIQQVNEVVPHSQRTYVESVLLPSPPSFALPFGQRTYPSQPDEYVESEDEGPTHVSPTRYVRESRPITYIDSEAASPPQLQGQWQDQPQSQPQPPSPPKGQRLPQVGRIPQVVSKRSRERKLSDQSFSRPFAPSHPRPAARQSQQYASPPPFVPLPEPPKTQAKSPSPTRASPVGSISNAIHPAIDAITGALPKSEYPSDFFAFPPRKNSERSYSDSSGVWSVPASTAMVPPFEIPNHHEDVWNEYDDLLDEMSPRTPRTPHSAGSSLGAPFHYSGLANEKEDLDGQSLDVPLPRGAAEQLKVNGESTLRSIPSLVTSLRRPSRLLSSLYSAGTPTTSPSFSDFLAGYGERNLSIVDPISGRLSLPPADRPSSGSVKSGSGKASARGSARSSLPPSIRLSQQSSRQSRASSGSGRRPSRQRDTRLMEIAETQNDGLESMANLRFGALMTSKWLSFGRVLFSPAHYEMKNPDEDRVLILDGLGKDWSYYCALTYPNAFVYNLGPNPNDGSSEANATPVQSLPNHRHIHHPLISSPFPFPKGFFAAVVFRFPVVTSDAAYRAAIFECKRVLRPGGHLEISMLDLDMLNMGNRARRAVRALKVKMQVADPSISLKPVSDNIQKLLGRRGFENLNRCMVGVPAAGKIPNSVDETASYSPDGTDPEAKPRKPEGQLNFSDLLRQSQDGTADEGITKLVARVGRWWFMRCYESVVLPEGDLSQSIWADDTLLHECEKRGTTLRLLICYAQKPAVPDNTKLGNIFCLIQTVDQKRVDKPTDPPIATFQTTFHDFSIEELGAYCKEKFDWNNPKSQAPYISGNEFAVLDSRTLEDETVLLVKYDYRDERIDPSSLSDKPEAFRECEGWRQIRVTMKSAPEMMDALQEIFMSQLFDSVKDGVYRTQKEDEEMQAGKQTCSA